MANSANTQLDRLTPESQVTQGSAATMKFLGIAMVAIALVVGTDADLGGMDVAELAKGGSLVKVKKLTKTSCDKLRSDAAAFGQALLGGKKPKTKKWFFIDFMGWNSRNLDGKTTDMIKDLILLGYHKNKNTNMGQFLHELLQDSNFDAADAKPFADAMAIDAVRDYHVNPKVLAFGGGSVGGYDVYCGNTHVVSAFGMGAGGRVLNDVAFATAVGSIDADSVLSPGEIDYNDAICVLDDDEKTVCFANSTNAGRFANIRSEVRQKLESCTSKVFILGGTEGGAVLVDPNNIKAAGIFACEFQLTFPKPNQQLLEVGQSHSLRASMRAAVAESVEEEALQALLARAENCDSAAYARALTEAFFENKTCLAVQTYMHTRFPDSCEQQQRRLACE